MHRRGVGFDWMQNFSVDDFDLEDDRFDPQGVADDEEDVIPAELGGVDELDLEALAFEFPQQDVYQHIEGGRGRSPEWIALLEKWKTKRTHTTRSNVSLMMDVRMGAASRHRVPKQLQTNVALCAPSSLRECVFTESLHFFNKIFASAWLGPDCVVTTSKDNKLALWDTKNPTGANNVVFFDPPAVHYTPFPQEMTGSHDVKLSPNGRMLATGAHNPNELVLLDLPTLKPLVHFYGHRDWMFGCEWLSDTRLLSCSRDRTLRVWNCGNIDASGGEEEEEEEQARPSLLQRKEHRDKVRAIALNRQTMTCGSLSADRTVNIWDCNTFDVVRRIDTVDSRDLVVLEVDDSRGLFAVGGMSNVSLIDPRAGKVIRNLDTLGFGIDEEGTRSVSFNSQCMCIGGGQGTLNFFDFCADRMIPLQNGHGMRISQGHIVTQGRGLWGRIPDNQAIYTTKFDATGSQLFVGGGPLLLGIDGCYAGIFV